MFWFGRTETNIDYTSTVRDSSGSRKSNPTITPLGNINKIATIESIKIEKKQYFVRNI